MKEHRTSQILKLKLNSQLNNVCKHSLADSSGFVLISFTFRDLAKREQRQHSSI